MTKKLIVAYRTKVVSDEVVEALMPPIQLPKSAKGDDEKKAADLQARIDAFKENARNLPYTGTFDYVTISAPSIEKVARWDSKGRELGGSKVPMCIAIRSWLLKHFPNAWSHDTHDTRKPEAVFIGFNPRRFVKMLGLECSLPLYGQPLPPKLWYSQSDYRDMESAVLPDDCKPLTLPGILKRRRPPDEAAGKIWDAKLQNWTAPGEDPETDLWLLTELAGQLGFLADD